MAKHKQLAKRISGEFAAQEWAILGLTCSDFLAIGQNISNFFSTQLKFCLVDNDHKNGHIQLFKSSVSGETTAFTLPNTGGKMPIGSELLVQDQDLALLNGNHYSAARQMIVLNPDRFDNIQRRLAQITQVDAFLIPDNGSHQLPSFLEDHLTNSAEIPRILINDTAEIAAVMREYAPKPPLKGLILSGGQSTRMGTDKGALAYHGKPQRDYLFELLQNSGIEAYYSIKETQKDTYDGQPVVIDTFIGIGPIGAILSAFQREPNTAWMVLACDLPFVTKLSIERLQKDRNYSSFATAFFTEQESIVFPEPLIAIWEPKSYPFLLQSLANGLVCPVKFLQKMGFNRVVPSNPHEISNVNTPEEREKAMKILNIL